MSDHDDKLVLVHTLIRPSDSVTQQAVTTTLGVVVVGVVVVTGSYHE